MSKTEKTIAELQIEKNMEYEFDKITEAGSELERITGPGYTGLTNLGNSCYMNSVLQVMWSMPEFPARFTQHAKQIFQTAPHDVASDFLTQVIIFDSFFHIVRIKVVSEPHQTYCCIILQFAKVGIALVQGAPPASASHDEDANAVKPSMFKSVIGKGHPEFATSRQQDAEEFLSYLLETVARAERNSGRGLTEDASVRQLFEFQTITRTECSESKKVRSD